MNNGSKPPRPTVKQIDRELARLDKKREVYKTISGTIKNIIVLAAAAVLLVNLLIAGLQVSRSSMSPTLQDGEIVVAIRWTSVNPGDIVAFYYNNNILLKRVIAKAGDWVNIDEDGTVYVNSEALDEPYITEKSIGQCDINMPYQVPDGSIFVMGDHRVSSQDSRLEDIGAVRSEYILGKIFFRIWPLPKFGFLG